MNKPAFTPANPESFDKAMSLMLDCIHEHGYRARFVWSSSPQADQIGIVCLHTKHGRRQAGSLRLERNSKGNPAPACCSMGLTTLFDAITDALLCNGLAEYADDTATAKAVTP